MSQTSRRTEKRDQDFEVNLENLINLNQKQTAWLIKKNVLNLSLNKSVFESLDKNIQERVLATGCIKQMKYEDPETGSINLFPPARAAQTEASADINEEYDEADFAWDKAEIEVRDEEEYKITFYYDGCDDGDPRPLDDDEWARSLEEKKDGLTTDADDEL